MSFGNDWEEIIGDSRFTAFEKSAISNKLVATLGILMNLINT